MYHSHITPQRCVQPVCKGGWGEGERGGTGIHGYTGLEEGGLLTIPVPYRGIAVIRVAMLPWSASGAAWPRWPTLGGRKSIVHPKGESTTLVQ